MIIIVKDALKGCAKLKTVCCLGCKLRTIEASAFADCLQLRQLRLPKGLRVIADGDPFEKAGAFSGCVALVSMIIPPTVQQIGDCAFFGATSLQTVVFEGDSQLSRIGRECFRKAGLKWIELPASVSEIGGFAFAECASLSRVWSAGEAPASSGEVRWPQRVTAIREFTFAGCEAIALLVLPPTLEGIGGWAFVGATSLGSVVFAADSRLSRIGYACFLQSGLTFIEIPASVREVECGAFQSCPRLTEVTFAEGSALKRVGNCAFIGCASLRLLQFAKESDPEIEGDNALMGCASARVLRIPRAAAAQFAASMPADCRVEFTF